MKTVYSFAPQLDQNLPSPVELSCLDEDDAKAMARVLIRKAIVDAAEKGIHTAQASVSVGCGAVSAGEAVEWLGCWAWSKGQGWEWSAPPLAVHG